MVKIVKLSIVFHPLTYEGEVDIDKETDPLTKNALEVQVNEYGQTPKQIFKKPHPKKFSNQIKEIFINEEKIVEIDQELVRKVEAINIQKDSEIEKEIVKDDHITPEEEPRQVNYTFNRDFICLNKFHKK